MAIVSTVFSIIIICLGISVYLSGGTSYTYEKAENVYSSHYDVKGASFGADFYTYMYDASDTIVSELDKSLELQNELNKNVVELKNTVGNVGNSISYDMSYALGMLIICIGISTLAFSLVSIGNAFAPALKSVTIDDLLQEQTENNAEQIPSEDTMINEVSDEQP